MKHYVELYDTDALLGTIDELGHYYEKDICANQHNCETCPHNIYLENIGAKDCALDVLFECWRRIKNQQNEKLMLDKNNNQ